MSSAESMSQRPSGASWPPDINLFLNEEERRAVELLYEQKMAEPPNGAPFLTFKLHNQRWGVPVSHLREVLPNVSAITPLPFSPFWLYGLINLHGEPVGLVGLSDLLLDPITAATVGLRTAAGAPVIIAESEGTPLGLLVEELGEVAFLEEEQFEQVPAVDARILPSTALSHLYAAWYPSQTAQPVLLLDLPRLMTDLLQQLTSGEARND